MGPFIGTIGGLGTWLALVLKTAFALIGMGAYLSIFWQDVPIIYLAIILAISFGIINLFGVQKIGIIQVFMVFYLLFLLLVFIVNGIPNIKFQNLDSEFANLNFKCHISDFKFQI